MNEKDYFYYDEEENEHKCTLSTLCVKDPAWAASRIEVMKLQISLLEQDCGKSIQRLINEKIEEFQPSSEPYKGSNRMEVDIDEEYRKNATHKHTKYGCEVSCNKGLWSITAPTMEEAKKEARHYFVQYFMDGEYNQDNSAILKGSLTRQGR